MAVAAAIGAGGDDDIINSNRLANATNRLSGKRSLLTRSPMVNNHHGGVVSQQHIQQANVGGVGVVGLTDINRSIEKMTLQPPSNNGEPSKTRKTTRRDSDWTSVSTEDQGYSSMRSDQMNNSSRRASELSSASQVHTI
jgi:hypothetical protein